MTAVPLQPHDVRSRRRARGQAAGACVIAAAAAAGVPMIAGGAPLHAQTLLAGVGFVALLAALSGRATGFTIAALAFAGEYSLRLASRHGAHRLDALAVLEAVALFATVELGLRSLEARSIARPERPVRWAAMARFTATTAGAGAAAFIVLALGGRRLPAPTVGLALGLGAAAALLFSANRLRRGVARDATARH
jgi:hypothetical protein